jgi:hypothetical protein
VINEGVELTMKNSSKQHTTIGEERSWSSKKEASIRFNTGRQPLLLGGQGGKSGLGTGAKPGQASKALA